MTNAYTNDKNIKKNNKIPSRVLLICIVLIVSISLTFVYARYTSTVKGNVSADVAKWSFKLNGQTQTIDDIILAETRNKNNSVAEGELAPGTDGRFDLELDATGSEVAIKYVITLQITEKPENLKFYFDSDYTQEISNVDGTMEITGNIPLTEVGTPIVKSIYWEWPYQSGTSTQEQNSSDLTDTADSKKTTTMKITVTGIQENPNENSAG